MVHSHKTAAARHVLHDDGGLAGGVIAKMACEQSRVNIAPTPDAEADEHCHLLAHVKVRHLVGTHCISAESPRINVNASDAFGHLCEKR
jgi:hypothetical protein